MNNVINTIKNKQYSLSQTDQDFYDIELALELTFADVGSALVAVDTSGSTPKRVIDLLPKLNNFLEIYDELVTFSTFVTPYEPDNPGNISQGGTDYTCVQAYAKGKKFDRIIVITDGEASFSETVYPAGWSNGVAPVRYPAPSAKKLKKKWFWFVPTETYYLSVGTVYDERVTDNISPIVTAYEKV